MRIYGRFNYCDEEKQIKSRDKNGMVGDLLDVCRAGRNVEMKT